MCYIPITYYTLCGCSRSTPSSPPPSFPSSPSSPFSCASYTTSSSSSPSSSSSSGEITACATPHEGCFRFATRLVRDMCPASKCAVIADSRIPPYCGMSDGRLAELLEVLQEYFDATFDSAGMGSVAEAYLCSNDPLGQMPRSPPWWGWHDPAFDLLFGQD